MEPEKYKEQVEGLIKALQQSIEYIKGDQVGFIKPDPQKIEMALTVLSGLAAFNLSLASVPGELIDLAKAKRFRKQFRDNFGGTDLSHLPIPFRFNKIRIDAKLLKQLLTTANIDSIAMYFGSDNGNIKMLLVPEDATEKPITNGGADVLDEMRPCPPPSCQDI